MKLLFYCQSDDSNDTEQILVTTSDVVPNVNENICIAKQMYIVIDRTLLYGKNYDTCVILVKKSEYRSKIEYENRSNTRTIRVSEKPSA